MHYFILLINKILLLVTYLDASFLLIFVIGFDIIMTLDKKNIKLKIDDLNREIKLLEDKINEISWKREK